MLHTLYTYTHIAREQTNQLKNKQKQYSILEGKYLRALLYF